MDNVRRVNGTLFLSAFAAALAGLLFGFDTAVISGVTESLRGVYSLDSGALGFTVSVALWGTIAGALFASCPGDRIGRRDSLKITGLLFLLSALGCAFATGWGVFVFSRFIGGLGIGAASVLAPMYIAEIAPARLRGRFVAAFQINVVGGILLAYLSNWLVGLSGLDPLGAEWRVKLGVEAVPAALFLWVLFYIPRSPRWLVKAGRGAEAAESLRLTGIEDVSAELSEIERSLAPEPGSGAASLFSRACLYPVFLAFSIAMFNQLSGINGLLYYINDIFSSAGFDRVSGDQQAVAIGCTNLVFTLAAMPLIDRVGRKTLLLVGAAGTSLAMLGAALVFYTGEHAPMLVWILVAYIAFFALSQGAVIWVYISEVFPNAVRARGQSLGSSTHWVFCAAVSYLFPVVSEYSKSLPFFFFAAMTVLQFATVLFFYPETKGVPLERIQSKMRLPRWLRRA